MKLMPQVTIIIIYPSILKLIIGIVVAAAATTAAATTDVVVVIEISIKRASLADENVFKYGH